MNQTTVVVLSAVTAILAGGATGYLSPSAPSSRAKDPSEAEATLAALRTELVDLQGQLSTLEQDLQRKESALQNASAANRSAVGGIDEAVARWMKAHLAERLEDRLASAGGVAASARIADDRGTRIAQNLLNGDLSWRDEQDLWQEARDAGVLEAVITELERQAEVDPGDPDLQTKLGEGYVQMIFEAGVGPLAMEWSEKADGAFDRALALDEEHWEARFNKAVSLSNWPAFLGKSNEAIRQFEILVEQQEGREPRGGFDQTYYFLGNMYLQIGQRDKAEMTWKQGLQLFPEASHLQTQLDSLQSTETAR